MKHIKSYQQFILERNEETAKIIKQDQTNESVETNENGEETFESLESVTKLDENKKNEDQNNEVYKDI